jgi:catechol 2,3-dioxygenase-like lactoylglutathione lyase family enzyme
MTHDLPPVDDLKQQARRLRTALATRGVDVPHGHALELVAAQLGHRDWNTLSAAAAAEPAAAGYGPVIPVLRIFDVDKAREFYLGFLGFREDWEHRFDDHSPAYLQVSREGAVLHLSEHHGDATPGATVRVLVPRVAPLQKELLDRDYRYARPGIETMPWGLEVQVGDPFANRIVFHQLVEDPEGAAAPIVHELCVDGSPEHALRVLTERVGDWWDPAHALPGVRDLAIEPGVGGACTMLLQDDAGRRTEVEVSLAPDGDGTRLRFSHAGGTAADRPRFTGWRTVLERYVEACRLP